MPTVQYISTIQRRICQCDGSASFSSRASISNPLGSTGVSVRKLAIEEGYVTEEEAEKLLDPYAMTGKATEPEAEYATYKKVANLG